MSKDTLLRIIGNGLIIFSILGVVATFGPAFIAEIQYQIVRIRGIQYEVKEPTKTGFGQLLEKQKQTDNGFAALLTGPKEQILIPKDTEFDILIPKLGANAKVFPNVNPNNEKEFLQVLQKGVAHASGSVFPGMKGTIYLFAHSADNFWDVGRYNAIFYLLKNLEPKDEVVIFFENKRHTYFVTETKIVNPDEVSYLVNSQKNGEEQLVLQTCWPPGTTWKRLLVIAKPK